MSQDLSQPSPLKYVESSASNMTQDNKTIEEILDNDRSIILSLTSENADLKREKEDLVIRIGQSLIASGKLESENADLKKENTFLRGLVAKLNIKCIHCGNDDISKCPEGLPGCSKADDLFCADEETLKRLIDEKADLKKQLEEANTKLVQISTELVEAKKRIEELQVEYSRIHNKLIDEEKENYDLRTKAEKLAEALENLMDVQNGPPLITYEKMWNEAMTEAKEAIKIWRGGVDE